MRIVHIIARLNDGGPARVLGEWCREGMRLGHEVKILCGPRLPMNRDISATLRAMGISITYLNELARKPDPFRDIKALRRITRSLRRLKPDLVHTHTAKRGCLVASPANTFACHACTPITATC